MKDPLRLLETERGGALELLKAARNVPAPPAEALTQALGALGIGAAPVAATAASSLGVLKMLTLGLGIGVAASAGISAVQDSPRAAESAAPKTALVVPTSSAAAAAATTAPAPGLEPLPVLPASRAPRRDTTSAAPSLAAEIAQLDRARAALASGQAPRALEILDEHARTVAPQLQPEAALLRLRALTAAGKPEAARALAEKLLRQSSNSGYAARVREAAGLSAP